MLVSAKEMLDKAVAGHYAVGQFNINNLEWTKIYSSYSRRVKVTSYLRCI
jgi:fruc_bis_ald_: fructose-1,6-bisphosphate aldolase, class II